MKALEVISNYQLPEHLKLELLNVPEKREDKIDFVSNLFKMIETEQKRIKKQEDDLALSRKKLEELLETVKDSLKLEMLENGDFEIKGKFIKFIVTPTSPSLKIVDESLIPDEYFETKRVLKKDILKAQLKLESVAGAELTNDYCLKTLHNKD